MEASRPRATRRYAGGAVLTAAPDDGGTGDGAETARLTALAIARVADGTPGYRLENPFGQTVQVMPKPPAFRATISLEWEGAMPDEVVALVERARAAGVVVKE